MLNHGCHDRRRVNTTRKISAERRVAPHANANGLIECPFEQANCIIEGLNVRHCRRKRWRKIACRFQRSALPYGIVTRLQLLHRTEKRGRPRDITIKKIVTECFGIERPVKARKLNERLNLRAEEKNTLQLGEKERFLAEGITGKYQRLLWFIPERKAEHAAQSTYRVELPGAISFDEHLGVRVRAKPVAEGNELLSQFNVIVD